MNECTFSYADGHKCSEKAAPELKPGLCGKHQRWTLKYGKKEHMMANDPRLTEAGFDNWMDNVDAIDPAADGVGLKKLRRWFDRGLTPREAADKAARKQEDADVPYRTLCSWCGATIKEGPQSDSQTSHGICKDCLAKMEKDLNMTLHKNEAQIVCRVCGKTIRGNAASEDYDPVSGEMQYTCKACDAMFKKIPTTNEAQMGKVLNFVDRFLEDSGSYNDPSSDSSNTAEGEAAMAKGDGWQKAADYVWYNKMSGMTDSNCPQCGQPVKFSDKYQTNRDFGMTHDRDGNISKWETKHRCGAVLTIFNDL